MQESAIAATGLAPKKDLESAIVATLEPGLYTVILSPPMAAWAWDWLKHMTSITRRLPNWPISAPVAYSDRG